MDPCNTGELHQPAMWALHVHFPLRNVVLKLSIGNKTRFVVDSLRSKNSFQKARFEQICFASGCPHILGSDWSGKEDRNQVAHPRSGCTPQCSSTQGPGDSQHWGWPAFGCSGRACGVESHSSNGRGDLRASQAGPACLWTPVSCGTSLGKLCTDTPPGSKSQRSLGLKCFVCTAQEIWVLVPLVGRHQTVEMCFHACSTSFTKGSQTSLFFFLEHKNPLPSQAGSSWGKSSVSSMILFSNIPLVRNSTQIKNDRQTALEWRQCLTVQWYAFQTVAQKINQTLCTFVSCKRFPDDTYLAQTSVPRHLGQLCHSHNIWGNWSNDSFFVLCLGDCHHKYTKQHLMWRMSQSVCTKEFVQFHLNKYNLEVNEFVSFVPLGNMELLTENFQSLREGGHLEWKSQWV